MKPKIQIKIPKDWEVKNDGKSFFNKFEEKIEKVFNILEHKIELYNWNKKIKKICKKYQINSISKNMYLNIQKELLNKINKDEDNKEIKKEIIEVLFPKVILQRVYEINKEFPQLILLEFFHSANALTRQLVEIYIRVLYIRDNPRFKKILLENLNEKFPVNRDIIEKLKKSKLEIPYIKGISKEKILDVAYNDFRYFSDLFHPSQKSFALNLWVSKKGKNSTSFYIDNPKLSEGDMLIFFSKKSIIPKEIITRMIHQFYSYSCFLLNEIKLIENEKTKN